MLLSATTPRRKDSIRKGTGCLSNIVASLREYFSQRRQAATIKVIGVEGLILVLFATLRLCEKFL